MAMSLLRKLFASRSGNVLRKTRATSRIRPTVELLEERAVPAVFATFFNNTGLLHIEGTAGNDVIEFAYLPGSIPRPPEADHLMRVTSAGQEIWSNYSSETGYTGENVERIRVYSHSGDDEIRMNFMDIPVRAILGSGNDKFIGGHGDDEVFGGSGNDYLDGFAGSDILRGGVGDDTLLGKYGEDALYGGLGNDHVDGGDGDDILEGGDGNDRIFGLGGHDTIYGDAGNDQIYGNEGNDLIFGNSGFDYIEGGTGTNSIVTSDDGSQDGYRDWIQVTKDGSKDIVYVSGWDGDFVTYVGSGSEGAEVTDVDYIERRFADGIQSVQIGVSYESATVVGAGYSHGIVFTREEGKIVSYVYESTFTSKGLVGGVSATDFVALYYVEAERVGGSSVSIHWAVEVGATIGLDLIYDSVGNFIGFSGSFGVGFGLPAEGTVIYAETTLTRLTNPDNSTILASDDNNESFLYAPAGETSDATPTFTWTAAKDTAQYELWVDNVSTGQSKIIHRTDLFGTSWTPLQSLPVGEYRAWIRPARSDGSGIWSEAHDFSIVPLLTPIVNGPAEETDNPTPVITWTDVKDADRYEIWINNTSTGQSQVVHQTNLNQASFVPSDPLAAGEYRVWIRAHKADGQASNWSAGQDFTVTPVLTPALESPTGVLADKTPTIAWSHDPNADTYELWVNNLTTGQSKAIYINGLATAEFTPSASLSTGDYRVWVRAHKNNGAASAWSNFLDFTIVDVVTPELFVSAPDNTETRPILAWTNEAATYELWVNNVTTGESQVIHKTNLTGQSYKPEHLRAGTYDAWVRSFDAAGNASDWSKVQRFDVTAPAAPQLIGPAGESMNKFPTFSWNAVNGAAHYELWVDNITTGQSRVIHNTDVTSTSFTTSTALRVGEYRFWVRAINSAGDAGNWSPGQTFRIAAPAAPLLKGPSGRVEAYPKFVWTTVKGAARYELWVDNLSTETSKVIHLTNLRKPVYSTTTPLPAGDYRFWVRAIDAQDEAGDWSDLLDFTVLAFTN